jgi:hypothetical protein
MMFSETITLRLLSGGRVMGRENRVPLFLSTLQLDFTIPEKPATASSPSASPATVWK